MFHDLVVEGMHAERVLKSINLIMWIARSPWWILTLKLGWNDNDIINYLLKFRVGVA